MTRPDTAPILVNGRILRHGGRTGVSRYAAEMVDRLDAVDVARPSAAWPGPTDHLWEQTVLVARSRGRLLWSPAGTAPVVLRRQVVTIHDTIVFDHPEWFSPRFTSWYRRIVGRVARRASHLVTDSEYSASRLRSLFGRSRSEVHVVPLGVGSPFVPGPTENSDGRPRVLVLGSADPRKAQDVAVAAWNRIERRHPDAEFVVQRGAVGAAFAESRLPAAPRLRVLGTLDDAELVAEMRAATIAVFVSRAEGFGLPLLEAMATGVPVIHSDIEPHAEIVGTDGLGVPVGDDEALARAMSGLLEDAARRQEMITAGLRIAGRYDWDSTARRLGSLLDEAQ